MKKNLIRILVVMTVVAGATVAVAANNVTRTLHNMSNYDPEGYLINTGTWHYKSDYVDQVCIFCHTPHNAKPNYGLWNKVLPSATTFDMYTSSPYLPASVKAVTKPGLESLLCLSCHDGRTAVNVLHNAKFVSQSDTSLVAGEYTVDAWGLNEMPGNPPGVSGLTMASFDFSGEGTSWNIGKKAGDKFYGKNLTDDHPIGFSYTTAKSEKDAVDPTALRPAAQALARGIKFFGPTNRVECSSCHDPHVDYGYAFEVETGSPTADKALKPFLRTSNAQSAMCLACHNK